MCYKCCIERSNAVRIDVANEMGIWMEEYCEKYASRVRELLDAWIDRKWDILAVLTNEKNG